MGMGKSSENVDRSAAFISASEKEFERALYFMPTSARIHFSLGCYWLYKSRVVEKEKAYFDSFDRFIHHFGEAYQINKEYKLQISQLVQQYYPEQSLDFILGNIFKNPT